MSLPQFQPSFILASGSPRRKELLEMAGFSFEIVKVDVDETVNSELSPLEIVDDLALRKMSACSELREKNLVITADTLVFKEDQILGKPLNRDEATKMIRLLSGAEHSVTTSVCLGFKDKVHQFNVTTLVCFEDLRDQLIEYYVDNFEPFDKAGSYGIQEWIGILGISRIEGSYTNVVGLPVAETYKAILDVGNEWNISN